MGTSCPVAVTRCHRASVRSVGFWPMIVKYAGVTPVLLTNVVGRTAGRASPHALAGVPTTATERAKATTSRSSFEYLTARFSLHVQKVEVAAWSPSQSVIF